MNINMIALSIFFISIQSHGMDSGSVHPSAAIKNPTDEQYIKHIPPKMIPAIAARRLAQITTVFQYGMYNDPLHPLYVIKNPKNEECAWIQVPVSPIIPDTARRRLGIILKPLQIRKFNIQQD